MKAATRSEESPPVIPVESGRPAGAGRSDRTGSFTYSLLYLSSRSSTRACCAFARTLLFSVIVWALYARRSPMASAMVGVAKSSCQWETRIWLAVLSALAWLRSSSTSKKSADWLVAVGASRMDGCRRRGPQRRPIGDCSVGHTPRCAQTATHDRFRRTAHSVPRSDQRSPLLPNAVGYALRSTASDRYVRHRIAGLEHELLISGP